MPKSKQKPNDRIQAALKELSELNWDDYITKRTDAVPLVISEGSNSSSAAPDTPQQNNKSRYSGYVFNDEVSQDLGSTELEAQKPKVSDSDSSELAPCLPGDEQLDCDKESTQIPQDQMSSNDDHPAPDLAFNDEVVDCDSDSETSDVPVLDVEEDDDSIESAGSLSSHESVNAEEILAHHNAQKNKDFLHESFLMENKKGIDSSEVAEAMPGAFETTCGGNSYNSVEGDTKSVTFADEDYIIEFDATLNVPEVIPLSMDPLDDCVALSADRNTDIEQDIDPVRTGDGFETNTPHDANDRESMTRIFMEQAVREEEEQVMDLREKGNASSELHSEDLLAPGEFQQLHEELDERVIAKDKLNHLLDVSPEFRAAILSLPIGEDVSVEGQNHLLHIAENLVSSTPTDRKSSLGRSYQPFSGVSDTEIESLNNYCLRELTPMQKKMVRSKNGSKSSPRRNCLGPLAGISPTTSMASSRQKNFLTRLSERKTLTASTPSLDLAPPPPKLSTECHNLPVGDIRKLTEMNASGDSYFISLDPTEEKLRVRLKVTDCPSDWEFSNKMDFFGLHFGRSEFMEFPCTTQHEAGSTLEYEDMEGDNKKKLLISHEDAYDFLYVNRIKYLRRHQPHIAQMNSLMQWYFLGFTCLVFDMKMQLLGSFDHKLGKFFPGLTVCPPHLQRRKRRTDDHRYANLLEIDFCKLPVEAFAIVPVIYDDSPVQAQFPELQMQCDLSLSDANARRGRRDSYWMGSNTLEQDSETTPIHEQFDVSNLPSQWNNLDSSSPSMSAIPDHVELLDENWVHVESFFCTREAGIPDCDGLIGPPPLQLSSHQTQSTPVKLPKQHSFVPFVIFKRLNLAVSDSVHAECDNDSHWSIKSIQRKVPGVMLQAIVRGVVKVLKEKYVLPLHVINIEHCKNCEDHCMTTWHVPGSYEKKFTEAKAAFRRSLPPAIIYSNKYTNSPDCPPRMGSFEVSVRPFSSSTTQLVFSKISTKAIPPIEKIVRDLAVLLLPETIKFQGDHTLELHVYDGYRKIPLKGATVYLYKVNSNISLNEDIESVIGENRVGDVVHDDMVDVESPAPRSCRSRNRSGLSKKNNLDDKTGLPHSRLISTVSKQPGSKDFTTKVITSKSIDNATFRHSSIFYKVRSWKKDEVAAWLRSFALDQNIINNAHWSGVVDGASFLANASVATFEKWGVKNRVKLLRMEKALNEILQEKPSERFDPFTDSIDCTPDTIPVFAQPARPKALHEADDVSYKLICSKKSDSRGLCFVNINVTGSYVLRIEGPCSTPYCSNAFQISTAGHSAFCASIKPRIGLARITIMLDATDDSDVSDLTGVLLAFVNMTSARRHISFAKMSSEKTLDNEDDHVSFVASLPGKLVKNNTSPSLSPSGKPPTLRREPSVGSILISEISARNKRFSMSRSSSIGTKPTKKPARALETTLWLPVGKYYSEVDGNVFTVVADDTYTDSDQINYWSSSEVSLPSNNSNASKSVKLVYGEKMAKKCHRRILSSSIRAFQKIYRRYKKDFLTSNIWAYLALRKGLKKLLVWIKESIRHKKATRIQGCFRMYRCRRDYRRIHSSVVKSQRTIKVWFAKKVVNRRKCNRDVILKYMYRWIYLRRRRMYLAAVAIQCVFRTRQAKSRYAYLLLQKRILLRVKRWVKTVRRRVALKWKKEEELAREAQERELMDIEHDYAVEYKLQCVEYEKFLMKEKALAVENHRQCQATRIKSAFRGYIVRMQLRNGAKAVIRLQKIFRVRRFEKRYLSRNKLKYVSGFPALVKHPQLLGATKILLGVYAAKTEEPSVEEAFVQRIASKVLTSPAVKIQSMYRMFRDRKIYISKRLGDSGSDGRHPPLYRTLTLRSVSSDHDEVSVYTSGSASRRYDEVKLMAKEDKYCVDDLIPAPSRVWDNGSNALLNKLGFINSSETVRDEKHTRGRSPENNIMPGRMEDQRHTGTLDPLDTMVSDFKGLFISPSRRMAQKYDKLFNASAVKIQALARGYIVRSCNIRTKNDLESQDQPLEQDIADSRTIRTESTPHGDSKGNTRGTKVLRQFSSFGSTVKKSLSKSLLFSDSMMSKNDSRKKLLRALSSDIISAADTSTKAVKAITENVKNKYNESAQQAREINEKVRKEQVRRQRIVDNEICVEDAVFNIRGLEEELLPRLNRQWYVGVFPQLEEYEVDMDGIEEGVLGGHDAEQAYEMSQNRLIGEAVRTANLSPFSKESFYRVNFNVHLADLCRYTRILVVIFIETKEEGDSGRVRPDSLPNSVSVPSVRHTDSKNSLAIPKFLPAFFGSCQLNGGLAFTPCGGRKLINLQSNPDQAIFLSRAQARRLATLKRIQMCATLCPVAIPSSKFLSTLMCPTISRPCYPSQFLDAYLFEKNEIDVKEFYGAAICMVRFSGKNLVSTRHRGLPNGVLQFTIDGKCIGKAIDYSEEIGTVTAMVAGFEHLLVCGSTGAVAIYVDQHPTETRGSLDCVRLIPLHRYPITLCTAVHRAGLEFLFTVDRKGYIGVVLMERGVWLRTYINDPFVPEGAHITGLAASRDKMYLGISNGHLITIDLTEIMNGKVDVAKNIRDYIIGRDAVFSREAGITCLAVMSAADVFGLPNEDIMESDLVDLSTDITGPVSRSNAKIKSRQRLVGMRIKPQKNGFSVDPKVPKVENHFAENRRLNPVVPLEGHVILVGGGNQDPRVKILRPLPHRSELLGGVREVGTLAGHSKAITQIVPDAGGRFIVTTSQGCRSMCVWNALTFNCEVSHENINAAFIGLGDNALFACSFKAPFLTIWREPQKIPEKKRYQRRATSDIHSQGLCSDDMEESIDGRPEIAMTRTTLWCSTTVSGGRSVPERSVSAAGQFLGNSGRRVVNEWRTYYDRGVKRVTKLPPPQETLSVPQASRPVSNNPGFLRSKKSLQKLASLDNVNTLGSLLEGSRSSGHMYDGSSIESSNQPRNITGHYDDDHVQRNEAYATGVSEAEQDYYAGFSYEHGCYFDEYGYAYNYDRNGNYFYYDTTNFNTQPVPGEYVPGNESPRLRSPDSNIHSSWGASPEEVGRTAEYTRQDTYGSGFYTESPERCGGGIDDSAVNNIAPVQGTANDKNSDSESIRSYTILSETQGNSYTPDSNGRARSPKNSEYYDRYGAYIGPSIDDSVGTPVSTYGDSFRNNSQLGRDEDGVESVTSGLSRGRRNLISFKRRHMHMSDSEEEDDEKLTSIFRSKKSNMDESVQEIDENLAESLPDIYDFHEEVKHQYRRDDGGNSTTAEESVVSSEDDRAAKITKRQELMRRGLLHHLINDDDDDDD